MHVAISTDSVNTVAGYTSNVACDQVATLLIARSVMESSWPRVMLADSAFLYFEVQLVAILLEVFLTHKFDEKPAYRIPSVRTMI